MKKKYRIIWIASLFMLSGITGFLVSFYQHRSDYTSNDIQQIETYHYPTTFVRQLQGDPAAGEKIFKQFCTSCHGNPPIIAIQAPRIGDQKAWQIRRKMGMQTLMKLTIMGVGAMPARGGCFECSDAQLRETILYILSHSENQHGNNK